MYLLNRSFQGVQNGTFAQCRLIIIFIYRFTSILGNKKFSGNTDPERWSNGLSAPTDSSHLDPKCILQAWKAASMKQLHNIYELGAGDCCYQSNLKGRLQYHFMNQILFPSPIPELSLKSLWFHLATTRSVSHTTKKKQYKWLQNYFRKILLKTR